MVFTINEVDVMSKYDTTYASESLTAVSGFKINGTDIGKSVTPGINGYTTDDTTTNDAFKTSNVSFNYLFSTSKPLVVSSDYGYTSTVTEGDYTFRESTTTAWHTLNRLTIPNIPGVQIPLRILVLGGGGGGGSGGIHSTPEGAGGGGAGTFLELTMTLNETHDQCYFYVYAAGGGNGGGCQADSTRGEAGEMGGDTYLRLYNPGNQEINRYIAEGGAGGGGNQNTGHAEGNNGNPDSGRRGSGGGGCGLSGNRAGGAAGDPTYLEYIYLTDQHPPTTVDATRAHNGGTGIRYTGGGGGGGAGGKGGTASTDGGKGLLDGGDGGTGYDWINGSRYAGGGGGMRRVTEHPDGWGSHGGGDRTAGAGVSSNSQRNAVAGTGSGGLGHWRSDGWSSCPHGGVGATGRISIGIPRKYTEADYNTFTPTYL